MAFLLLKKFGSGLSQDQVELFNKEYTLSYIINVNKTIFERKWLISR